MKYNQPPIPMSEDLTCVLRSSLGLTDNDDLTEVLDKIATDTENVPPKETFLNFSKYCFGELNAQANIFRLSGYSDIEQASADLINRVGLHDLQQFINECKG